jgi:hypothetical protein
MKKKINLIIFFFFSILMPIISYGMFSRSSKVTKGLGKISPTLPRIPQSGGQKTQPSLPSSTTIPSPSKISSSEKTKLEMKRHKTPKESTEEKTEESESIEAYQPIQNLSKIVDTITTHEKEQRGTIIVHNSLELAQYLESLTQQKETIETEPNTWSVQRPGEEIFRFQRLSDDTWAYPKSKNEEVSVDILDPDWNSLNWLEKSIKEKMPEITPHAIIQDEETIIAALKKRITPKKPMFSREKQEKIERGLAAQKEAEEKQAAAEKLRTEEEAAQQKAAAEQAQLAEEQLKKEVDILHEQIEKEFTNAQLAEQERIATEAHIKEVEQEQERIDANKSEQQQLLKEIAEDQAKLDELEREDQERRLKIEQLHKEWQEKETALELEVQKEAEALAIRQKDAEEIENAKNEELQKINTQYEQQLQAIEAELETLQKKPKEQLATEKSKEEATKEELKEERKEEKKEQEKEKKEEQKKEEKEQDRPEGAMPPNENIKQLEKGEEKEIEENGNRKPIAPMVPQKEQLSVPQEEEKIEEAILPQITPEIIVTQPKKETTPIPDITYQPIEPSFAPSFAESFGGHGKATEGRPTGITPRWTPSRFAPYVPQAPTPSSIPSTSYGAGGTPSPAESIGWGSTDLINPYTQRIGLPPRVAPKEEIAAQETKIEKKVQPEEQIWWEKLLPKWIVQYLGRKDRTIQEKASAKKTTPISAPEEEKPAKKAGIIETIVETIKKPISKAVDYIRSLFYS